MQGTREPGNQGTKTWKCKYPRCKFGIQYSGRGVPGRKIQAHNRSAHGVHPERKGARHGGAAMRRKARMRRAEADAPAKTSNNARSRKTRLPEYCEHCGASFPDPEVMRVFRALQQNGVGSQAAMEAAKIAVTAIRKNERR